MSGHGHVVPNPNGLKARCGGPAICSVCAKELHAFKDSEIERLRADISSYEENEIQLEQWVEERDAEILALKQRIRALESREYGSGSGGQVGSHADLHATGVRHPNVDGSSSTPAIRPDDGWENERLRARVAELEAREEETRRYADRLSVNIKLKHFSDRVPDWQPLPDTLGILTQIGNMTAGIGERVAELEAAQEMLRDALYYYTDEEILLMKDPCYRARKTLADTAPAPPKVAT